MTLKAIDKCPVPDNLPGTTIAFCQHRRLRINSHHVIMPFTKTSTILKILQYRIQQSLLRQVNRYCPFFLLRTVFILNT